MFAERQAPSIRSPFSRYFPKKSDAGGYLLASDYRREASPLDEVKKNLATNIRQFDLAHSFYGLPKLIERFGKEQALFQSVLGVLLNIWALRQEMLGTMDTRELITLVHLQGTAAKFQNDLYGQSHDLEAMFYAGLEFLDPLLQPRFRREAKQAIEVFRFLVSPLQQIDFTQDEKTIETKLLLQGFHKEKISVSASMIALVPSLRQKIQSITDLDQIISTNATIDAWVSPVQTITVSPPHWSHGTGESAFVWGNEAIYLPDSREVFIRQNGKFGKASEEALLPYLSYGHTGEQRVFQTEEELMMFCNVIMEAKYRQPKVLLDYLVGQFQGIEPMGKFDRNARSGTFPTKEYFEGLYRLFEFELENLHTQPIAIIAARLGNFSDQIKHKIARNTSKGLSKTIDHYISILRQNPSLSRKQFVEKLEVAAVRLDPGLRAKIDFSAIDCTVGTVMNFGQMNTLTSLQSSIGLEKLQVLSQLEGMSISNRGQFEHIARLFGKDPSRFQEWGVCKNKDCESGKFGQKNFLGECGWCLSCELKDDMGLHVPLHYLLNHVPNSSAINGHHEKFVSAGPIGLDGFVAGLANPKLYYDMFLTSTTPHVLYDQRSEDS